MEADTMGADAREAKPGEAAMMRTSNGGSVKEMVRFDRVVKRYGDNVVLDELDFHAAPGERITLIGPSGSGKTTILRLLMTLEKADEGRIYVDGQCLTHMARKGSEVAADEKHIRGVRKKIGMVFQQFNLFPNMKVLRNVSEAPMRVLGMPREKAEAEARRLLDLVGLSNKADAYPSQLSGGQQQRVAIARACAMQPKILLLDEVTSALDPELVGEVLNVLRDIAATTDITMLCVTHEMKFARDISDRVLMFNAGRIVEQAPPEKLFTAPEHERTKAFLRAVLEEH